MSITELTVTKTKTQAQKTVIIAGPNKENELRNIPADIFLYLKENPDKLVSYYELVKQFWGPQCVYNDGFRHSFHNHLVVIRKFIKNNNLKCEVQSVTGKGLIFKTLQN